MTRRQNLVWALVAGLLVAVRCLAPAPSLAAETVTVEPVGKRLAEALAAAGPGDTLVLLPGVHAGNIFVTVPGVTLVGEPGAIIDAGGVGRVITIAIPDVTVRGLSLRNSGSDFTEVDAGVFVDRTGDGAQVIDNHFEGNLFGVYLHGPDDAVVRGNQIVGSQDPHVNDRGNGVHLWNSPGSIIEGNDIQYGRDGIFVTTSNFNVFRDNRFRDLRFAIHYMYANDSEISGNVSVGNHVGYALMYSHRMQILDNVSDGDRDHGIMFNYANESHIEGNLVRQGKTKCVFLYNSNKNQLRRNRFEGCAVGIHFTAGSERNVFSENAFIGNETQVKYVGTRWLEWSDQGRGNFWSDNSAFDLDGDGIADTPYKPNDMVDQVVWRHPLAKLLLTSPAVQILRWAQEQFPALHPGGVIDSAPLMRPPGQDIAMNGRAGS
jgi:nitrous oxidase accessory protein